MSQANKEILIQDYIDRPFDLIKILQRYEATSTPEVAMLFIATSLAMLEGGGHVPPGSTVKCLTTYIVERGNQPI